MTLPCRFCESTGQVAPERAAEGERWEKLGRALRATRMEPEYRSLREEAARRGLTVVELSDMERGLVEPTFGDLPPHP